MEFNVSNRMACLSLREGALLVDQQTLKFSPGKITLFVLTLVAARGRGEAAGVFHQQQQKGLFPRYFQNDAMFMGSPIHRRLAAHHL